MSTTEITGIQRDDTVHGETYFTAADMATAAAQGFREGQAAELAAMRAGGGPVAWARNHSRAPESDAPQPSPTPQADSQPAPLSRQQICDKFSFLEGMVNEWGFDRIVSRAEEIQARAIAARAQAYIAPAGGLVSVPSEPTAEMYRAAQKFVYSTGEDGGSIVLNTSQVRALWQAMRAAAASTAVSVSEPVFAFRRKGLDDFCTCTEKRYAELSAKPNLFETRIFYTTPPTQAADSVLEDAARLERERICAAIKAEDDYCVEHGDYMLDSDDCIKIVRGEWVRPDYLVDAARKQGGA